MKAFRTSSLLRFLFSRVVFTQLPQRLRHRSAQEFFWGEGWVVGGWTEDESIECALCSFNFLVFSVALEADGPGTENSLIPISLLITRAKESVGGCSSQKAKDIFLQFSPKFSHLSWSLQVLDYRIFKTCYFKPSPVKTRDASRLPKPVAVIASNLEQPSTVWCLPIVLEWGSHLPWSLAMLAEAGRSYSPKPGK